MIYEICSFLTTYEIYNIFLTSKELNCIKLNSKLWTTIIQRDFNIYTKIEYPFQFAIDLDCCKICMYCISECSKECEFGYKNVFKTACTKDYKLKEEELKGLESTVRYNNVYHKYTTSYNNAQVRQLVCKKYNGWTNFILFKNNLTNIKLIKQQKALDKKKIIENKYLEWKKEYKLTFNYSDLKSLDRENLLKQYAKEHNIRIREDSYLCQSFIIGEIKDMSIDYIIAILQMTSILFNYSHIVYSEYHEICKEYLMMLMFTNKKNIKYTWSNAVEDTENAFEDKFSKYRYQSYHY